LASQTTIWLTYLKSPSLLPQTEFLVTTLAALLIRESRSRSQTKQRRCRWWRRWCRRRQVPKEIRRHQPRLEV
jgi:hypothetical protein